LIAVAAGLAIMGGDLASDQPEDDAEAEVMKPTSLVILLALLAIPAAAQMPGEDPKTCIPNGPPFGADHDGEMRTKEWPQEAARIKRNEQDVSRHGDRLRLSIGGGGRSVELVDCPFGDTGYTYLYERYDEAGRFYVVRTPAWEDLTYTLVMRETGRLFAVHGTPVWASDKRYFLTIGCSLLPERGVLAVWAPAGDGIAREAEIELPCATESCSARFDFQSWISVTCTPRDGTTRKGKEFVVLRGRDGTWQKMGR
jgi:hypothetical protein